MQLFSEKLIELWSAWDVRLLILMSLILQVILIIFGSQRKFTASIKVRILVWVAYMIADPVATVALGNLADSQGDSEDKFSESNNVLQSFWAPFLLLHLGGPDTITAYSLEDNELWLRHFLQLIAQVGVAFYVFFRSWRVDAVTFITIPMFLAGMIKYGERTFVLRASSREKFKDSLHSSPASNQAKECISPQVHYLVEAFLLFNRSAFLFADLILDYYGQIDSSYCIIHEKSAKEAFKLVEVELGFMYDILYTKATIIYSRYGIFLRCISLFSYVTALIVFSVIIDIHAHPIADISMTYLLLVAAVFLEIYAFILFLYSNRTQVWLIEHNTEDTPKLKSLFHCLSKLKSLFHCVSKKVCPFLCKRQLRSMAHYNLVNSFLKSESATFIVVRISKLIDMKRRHLTWKSVDIHLQEMIFGQIQNKSKEVLDEGQSLKQLLDRRGDYVLENNYSLDVLHWSTIEVEFDSSLLVWHIATDLCYYGDLDSYKYEDHNCNDSKALSDYMLYLLVFCPSMLRKGISHEIRYRDTYNAIKSIINETSKTDGSLACKLLLEQVEVNRVVDDNLSVLHLGCKLAKNLQGLDWNYQKKWKMISEVWTEMLLYAASHCAWKEHQQQLRKGGELLTYVSLIMAHFGLSEQYRMKDDAFVPERNWHDLF